MQRILRWLACSLVLVGGVTLVAIAVVDLTVVQPLLTNVQAAMTAASPGEKSPPESIVRVLSPAPDGELSFRAARILVNQSSAQFQPRNQLRRQFTELAAGLLIPLHLSEAEITTFVLARTSMGPDVHGFNNASLRYFGVPLEQVSTIEAATLVAISYAPVAYLSSPERLARRARSLLPRSHE